MKMQNEPFIEQIRFYFAREEWSELVAACERSRETTPLETNIYPFLAKAYARLGKLDEAIASYRKLLGTELEKPEVYAQLGLLSSKNHQLDEAVRYYRQALDLKPNWTKIQFNLAVIFHQLENWELAIAAYQKTLELEPNAPAYFNLGAIYYQQNNLAAAAESYEQALALQPERMDVYSNLGNIYSRLQRYGDAITSLRRGLELDPTLADLHHDLGRNYWLDGQLELSVASFEYAIAIDPKMAVAYHNLGRLWQQQGDCNAAIECFRQVAKLEPQNILAASRCADILSQVGRLKEAIDYWQQIVVLQPTAIAAYIRRGTAIQPQNLLEMANNACARFLAVLESKSNYEEIYYYLWQTYCCLGEIWYERGEFELAKIYFQQASEIKTDEPELYLRLGNCLAKQQRFDAAITIYRLGLLASSDCRELKVQLSKIIRKKSPLELFPVDNHSSQLPHKLYRCTQDWARDCRLNNFDYTTVAWEENYSQPQISKKQHPESIASQTANSDRDWGSYHSKLIPYFAPKQLGQNVYQCCFTGSSPVAAIAPFVVTIPQGRAWIASQKNSWQICNAIAIITPDGYLLEDLSPSYSWFLPISNASSDRHPLFCLDKLPPAAEIKGKVVVLSGLAGHSYERWMLDILPKIELIRRSGIDLDSIDWFVVNNIDRSFQKETLAHLKIPPTKILSSDRYSHIATTDLIVPSPVGDLTWIPSGAIEFLRQTFLSDELSASKYNTKIFVPGLSATERQIIELDEAIELLNKHDFQTVWLEELSVAERITLFANAEVIVAPHSSVLANLVFCQPNTKVIELFSPNYINPLYWSISRHLRLRHYYLLGNRFDCEHLRLLMYQTPAAENISLDLGALELVIKSIEPE